MRIKSSFLLFVLLYGCGSIKEAQKSANHPNCRSVVEAYYTTDTTYTTKPPFLLLKKPESFNGTRYLYGGIVSINDTGVIFLRSKKSKFFPYEEIECLIDSNNHIAYGEWKRDPEVIWNIELVCQKANAPNSDPFSIILEANRVSSYCIPSGEYKILYINFFYDEYLDQSDSLKFSRFEVHKNAITYIGTFHSEYKWNLTQGVNYIPVRIIKRGSSGAAAAGVMFGAIGGLVAGLAEEENLNRERKSACFHGMSVTIDSSFKLLFKGSLPLIQSQVIIEDKRPN
jgi:hypothetical protein